MNPLVSIIIPCYNMAAFVGETIDSALAQTYANIEVVVVDDGSTDHSLDVIHSYGDRIRWTTGPNRGPGGARNEGLRLARGEFIQYLDADDLLLPGKVDACMNAFAPGVDQVFSDGEYFVYAEPQQGRPGALSRLKAGLGRALRRQQARLRPHNLREYLLRVSIVTPGPLHRASLLRSSDGYREDLRYGQDAEFYFRLALTGGGHRFVNAKLIRCRRHRGPHRRRLAPIPESVEQNVRATSAMLRHACDAGAMTHGVRRALADRFAKHARTAVWAERPELAHRLYGLACRLHPHPEPTVVPAYNAIAWSVGLERTEKWVRAIANAFSSFTGRGGEGSGTCG